MYLSWHELTQVPPFRRHYSNITSNSIIHIKFLFDTLHLRLREREKAQLQSETRLESVHRKMICDIVFSFWWMAVGKLSWNFLTCLIYWNSCEYENAVIVFFLVVVVILIAQRDVVQGGRTDITYNLIHFTWTSVWRRMENGLFGERRSKTQNSLPLCTCVRQSSLDRARAVTASAPLD